MMEPGDSLPENTQAEGSGLATPLSKYLVISLLCMMTFMSIWVWYSRAHFNIIAAEKTVTTSTTFGNPQVEKAITDYLLTQKHFSWKNQTESYNFCAIENLEPGNQLFPLSVWVFCAEYAEEGGELKEVGGSSLPAKINYPNELSFYDQRRFTHEAPRDGSSYTPDIKEIFSTEAQSRIFGHNVAPLVANVSRKAHANLISWNSIKSALANCEVKSLFQNHSNEVKVTLKNGTEISAIEPTIDMIMDLATASGCGKIQMATE